VTTISFDDDRYADDPGQDTEDVGDAEPPPIVRGEADTGHSPSLIDERVDRIQKHGDRGECEQPRFPEE
jgi:hypothetical protein